MSCEDLNRIEENVGLGARAICEQFLDIRDGLRIDDTAADEKKAKGLDVQAKERQRQSKGRGVKKEKHSAPGREVNGRSSNEAAAAFGVSGRSVDRAQVVI